MIQRTCRTFSENVVPQNFEVREYYGKIYNTRSILKFSKEKLIFSSLSNDFLSNIYLVPIMRCVLNINTKME